MKEKGAILMVIIAITFIGCKSSEKKDSEIFLPSTGEAYFRAIYYGEGDFPKEISVLQPQSELYAKLSIENKKKSELILKYIINKVKFQDSLFFNSFNNALNSGERTKIIDILIAGNLKAKELNFYSALQFYRNYSLDEMTTNLERSPINENNTLIAKALNSPTVISTILDNVIVPENAGALDVKKTVPTRQVANLYLLADILAKGKKK